MSLKWFQMTKSLEVVKMKWTVCVTDNEIILVFVIWNCKRSIFLVATDFLAESFENILLGNMERSFSFWKIIHSELLIILICWESVFNSFLLMEGVYSSQWWRYFFDINGEEFSCEGMSFPWIVLKGSEFERTEKEDDWIDFECVFGPWESGNMMEVESWLRIGKDMINFSGLLFADVQVVIFLRVEERVDGGRFDFDVVEWPEDDLVAESWLLEFHWIYNKF